jgi:uncharacterized membrane protein
VLLGAHRVSNATLFSSYEKFKNTYYDISFVIIQIENYAVIEKAKLTVR